MGGTDEPATNGGARRDGPRWKRYATAGPSFSNSKFKVIVSENRTIDRRKTPIMITQDGKMSLIGSTTHAKQNNVIGGGTL